MLRFLLCLAFLCKQTPSAYALSIISIIIITSSLLVILSKNPIHSVLFLILVFDLNGKLMKEFPVNQNLSDTSEPYGVFVYDDLIFVSDVGDSSVKIFDLDGNFVKQFGQYGDRYGEFNRPNLAITDGNRIFVSDAFNYRIQIFDIAQ